jgi:hypothetical protein
MSSILYYSNFCEHSKKLLQGLSNTSVARDIHFLCVDKRLRENNKTYLLLENGQKIILPDTVNRVPALLLLNNYNVLYGEAIAAHLKPRQEVVTRHATQNNMEPMAFSFGGGACNIVSDHYSFLDMAPDELSAKGSGGLRQMHNYVDLQYRDAIPTPADETDYKTANKIPSDLTVEQLQQQREQEYQQSMTRHAAGGGGPGAQLPR